MTWRAAVAALGLLFAAPLAAESPAKADRKAFYDLVDRYQMFVVPHCMPELVDAYRTQNAERDAAFVRSLQGTKLAGVYADAVADRMKHDRKTTYDCARPPLPPPPPGAVKTAAQHRRVARAEARRAADEQMRDRTELFTEGDRIFAEMAAIRDRTLVAPRD